MPRYMIHYTTRDFPFRYFCGTHTGTTGVGTYDRRRVTCADCAALLSGAGMAHALVPLDAA